jgi:hypothetical protein
VTERRFLLRWSEVWFGSSILLLFVGLLRSLLGVLPLDAAGPTKEILKKNIYEDKINLGDGSVFINYDSRSGISQDNSDLDLYLFFNYQYLDPQFLI